MFSFFDYNKDFDCLLYLRTLCFLFQKNSSFCAKVENIFRLRTPFTFCKPFWLKQACSECRGLYQIQNSERHFHFWLRQKWKCEQNITHDCCLTWCWLFSFPKFGNKLICFYDIWAQIWIYLQLVWSNHIQRRLEAHVKNTMSHHLETDIKTILVEYWELNYFGNTKNVNVNI